MQLTIDLGNTSTKLGLFDGDLQVSFLCADGVHDNYRSLILSFKIRPPIKLMHGATRAYDFPNTNYIIYF